MRSLTSLLFSADRARGLCPFVVLNRVLTFGPGRRDAPAEDSLASGDDGFALKRRSVGGDPLEAIRTYVRIVKVPSNTTPVAESGQR
jgi:hypothetical protein